MCSASNSGMSVLEIWDGIILDFYPGLPLVHVHYLPTCNYHCSLLVKMMTVYFVVSPAVGSAGRVPPLQSSVGTTGVSACTYMEHSSMVSSMYTVHISMMNVQCL